VKYEVVKDVPAYHWVTECVCDECGCSTHLDTRPAEMPADMPPPPPGDGQIVPTSAQLPVARPIYDQPTGVAPAKKRSLLDMLLGN
jgi:hypothetical protein